MTAPHALQHVNGHREMLAHKLAEGVRVKHREPRSQRSRAPRRDTSGGAFSRNDASAPQNVPRCEVRPVSMSRSPDRFETTISPSMSTRNSLASWPSSTTGPASYTSMRALVHSCVSCSSLSASNKNSVRTIVCAAPLFRPMMRHLSSCLPIAPPAATVSLSSGRRLSMPLVPTLGVRLRNYTATIIADYSVHS